MSEILRELEKTQLRTQRVQFAPGDTLRVHVRIKEGEKERIQIFQGIVIGRRGSGVGATFTVRKVTGGVGVERIFPLHSPNISKIERLKQGDVRRAKLYYLRELSGKSARITEKKRDLAAEAAEAEAAAVEVEAEAEVAEVAVETTEK